MKKIISILGKAGLFMFAVIWTMTFLVAYFNGYQVLVIINDYGEAHIELVMILIIFPLSMYYLFNKEK